MEKIYTPKEVAQMLGLNVQTVRKYTRTGELKSFNIGGYIKIREQDLQEFISQRARSTEKKASRR